MFQRWMMLSCLAVSLTACVTTTQGGSTTGSKQSDKAPPVVSNEPAQIIFRAEVLTKSGEGISLDAEGAHVLHSGDKVAFYVTLTQQAYAYVGIHTADGEQTLLFPADPGHQETFSPGSDYRIPGVGKWLVLDQETGQEDIFLYASKKQLTKEEVFKLLDSDRPKVKHAQPQTPKPKARPKPRPKPKDADDDAPGVLAVRGLKMVESDPTEVKDGGITSKHFVIKHKK
jgi:hypothetical protein